MVEYSTWVSTVRSVAGQKGADVSDFDTNSEVIGIAAQIWNDRKAEIEAMSQSQARKLANQEVSVA